MKQPTLSDVTLAAKKLKAARAVADAAYARQFSMKEDWQAAEKAWIDASKDVAVKQGEFSSAMDELRKGLISE